MIKNKATNLFKLLGIELSPVTHTERIVSAAGGFAGIYGILLISTRFAGPEAAPLIVASMGASAVLLFAVPHGPLSQPWPVFGGHLLSALVGVSCAKLIPDTAIAAACAVALAIGIMHYMRCIHPPGGATALVATVGGAGVQTLGYQYVLTPVLLNTLVILAVAVLFNYPFTWRRYPTHLKNLRRAGHQPVPGSIAHEDLVYALSEVNSFVDVSEQDLLTIYELAARRSESASLDPSQIKQGAYYSNGRYGSDWSVRWIIDEARDTNPEKDRVIYKVVAGQGLRSTGVATRAEFARWAKHAVYRDDENWRRVE